MIKIINKYFLLSLFIIFTTFSCVDDESIISDPFVVAFETLSLNLVEIEESQNISLVYSEMSSEYGSLTILLETDNALYGSDFITDPPVENNNLTIPIIPGENQNSILFTKLNENLDETAEIRLNIIFIEYPDAIIQGNSSFVLNSSASLGRGFQPNVGGPNEPNQVYVDLSTENQTVIKRDSWDLGFYGGSEFRVDINGSIYMAAGNLSVNNIDLVTQEEIGAIQDLIAVGTFDPANEAYVDNPDGDIEKTAIAPISEFDNNNKVYLLNLGYEVGNVDPNPGSVNIAGDSRGWKKIRILRQGDGYLLQHANIQDTTHEEIFITKSTDYNFRFFSFSKNNFVTVEPYAENWDINFTVFTNVLEQAGSYGFADGVLHNRKGGVTAYSVYTDDISYESFQQENIVESNFQSDQRTIGSSWRNVLGEDKVLIDNIFYIIKDPNGNYYKLKFTALLNDKGVRGFPEFKYKLL